MHEYHNDNHIKHTINLTDKVIYISLTWDIIIYKKRYVILKLEPRVWLTFKMKRVKIRYGGVPYKYLKIKTYMKKEFPLQKINSLFTHYFDVKAITFLLLPSFPTYIQIIKRDGLYLYRSITNWVNMCGSIGNFLWLHLTKHFVVIAPATSPSIQDKSLTIC